MPVELKKGSKITFVKTPSGIVKIRLLWDNEDVDLAALWEDMNGKTGCIQALGNEPDRFGSLGRRPFIILHGDSRTGGEELMEFNLVRADQIKRIIIFAYIYPYDLQGRPRSYTWKDIRNARVVITHPTQGEFVFHLDQSDARSCTLMDFQSNGQGGLDITPLGQFFAQFHDEIDRFYGWPNINWSAGTKD